ncbi:TIR domain-containing protein [Novacetimonas hansenii]|uniref:TIR domain-containing protein n=1 Tax=Novacetimonas hansenii TaxID=436 RepID=UPI00079783DF|nr:TIR domain-containing protein [Novacetimonas hansenii]WEQ57781.1 TIR domain-containing protein [Novacetimonas hansenii]CUW46305.1 hypothetical protein ATCC53582_00397 [Novacetimonas hansenii]
MARRTFFSFHYQPDVNRAWVVRNSWVTKVAQGERNDAGFFDSSVFEASKKESDDALKRFLREGLKNTTVTCVLVGAETSLRRWVRYEIFRSFMRGNGLLAVRIHNIGSLHSPTSAIGHNPFQSLAFTVNHNTLEFKEFKTTGWQSASDVGTMPLNDVAYDLEGRTNHTFSCLFPIYDWTVDNGYDNLGAWIETAAKKAKK